MIASVLPSGIGMFAVVSFMNSPLWIG
jgi:hypothetical protein